MPRRSTLVHTARDGCVADSREVWKMEKDAPSGKREEVLAAVLG